MPGPASGPLTVIDAGSAALFAGLRIALGGRPLPLRWAHPVAFSWGLILALIVLVHLRLLAEIWGAPAAPADDTTGQGVPSTEVHQRNDHSLFDVEVVSHYISFGEWPALLAIVSNVTERKQMAAERERIIAELKEALASVKTLRGLIPICASCKKIRDDQGYWSQVEVYVRDRSEAQFSHGIGPDCRRKLYGR